MLMSAVVLQNNEKILPQLWLWFALSV